MTFRFRQFDLEDDRSSMRIGTDAVLLGAWIHPENRMKILDVGTGCGILAFMMAQKSLAEITAIDIDHASAEQASANFCKNRWNTRMKAIHCRFQEFPVHYPDKFDLVVTNPPFFRNSLKSTAKVRNIARHDEQLNSHDLLSGVVKILRDKGRFSLILPAENAFSFSEEASGHALFLNKQMVVRSKLGSKPVRILMEFSHDPTEASMTEEMIIRNHNNSFTEAYRELTKDFYLGL